MKRDPKRKGYCGTLFVTEVWGHRFYSRVHPAVEFGAAASLRPLYRVNLYKRERRP